MTDFIDSTGGEVKVKLNPDGSIPTGPAGSGGGSSGAEPVNLKQVGGAAIALGRTTAAASLPVTLASDQPPPMAQPQEARGRASAAQGA